MRALALLAALAAHPAAAQTVAEAAAANAQLAMTLCVRNNADPDALFGAFRGAGFLEEIESEADGATIHWFHDPAGTVLVNVQAGVGPTFCAIHNDHMGVAAAVGFTGAVLEQAFPGVFTPGRMDTTLPVVKPGSPDADYEPCTGLIGFAPRQVIVVTVGIAGQDPVCVENGTSQVMMEF